MPATTFLIITRWFLIQIAYNIGNVAKTDKLVRTNGAPLYGSVPANSARGQRVNILAPCKRILMYTQRQGIVSEKSGAASDVML